MHKIPLWTELSEAAAVILGAVLFGYLARLVAALLSTPTGNGG